MEIENDEIQNPYYLFSENVWEVILENLEDSKDIQNILKAFPVLEEDFKFPKKKSYWLMDQILPFIAPKIRQKPDRMLYGDIVVKFDNEMEELLLTCRLVCKRWAAAVDKLLENKFHVNNSRLQNTPASDWNDCKSYNSLRIYPSYTFPTQPYWFVKPESFLDFQNKMRSHPPNRNPFLSRSITISSQPGTFTLDGCQVQAPIRFGTYRQFLDKDLLWRNTSNLFTDFGKHLYKFRLFVGWQDGASHSFWKEFPKCLQKLPNLKRLEITGEYLQKDYWDYAHLNGIYFTSSHPHLTQLRIDYDSIPVVLADILISYFSSQLEQLELHNDRHEWMELRGSHIFPKLKELSIQNSSEGGIKITNWLNTITAPLLSRLTASASYQSFSIKRDVFVWLKLFPKLVYLEANMGGRGCQVKCLIVEDETFTGEEISSLASLEYLKIYDSSWLTFNFLQWLPALRHLHIVTGEKPTAHTIPNDTKIFLRHHIQTGQLYESNVWSVLPSLRTITLTVQTDPYCSPKRELKFDRTTLNELSRNAALRSYNDHPLRKDILKYLEESVRLEFWFRVFWEQCTCGNCGGHLNMSDEYYDDSDTFDEFEDFLNSIKEELDEFEDFEENCKRIRKCRDGKGRKNKKEIKHRMLKN